MTLSLWRKEYVARLAPLYPSCEVEGLFLRTVEHFWKISRLKYSLEKDVPLSGDRSQKLAEVLDELSTGRPLQYITGIQRFFSRDFRVDSRVLIPRGETEELVALVLRGDEGGMKRVIDVGTGSGAIAVTLAAERPQWKVAGVDISPGALEVARINAEASAVGIDLLQGDILDGVFCDTLGSYEVVVSNPPYIREGEKADMHRNVLDYEPRTALFVPDEDPLLFYRAIGRFAVGHLVPGGRLYFEINEALGRQTAGLLSGIGLGEIEIFPDINGRDRIVAAVKKT